MPPVTRPWMTVADPSDPSRSATLTVTYEDTTGVVLSVDCDNPTSRAAHARCTKASENLLVQGVSERGARRNWTLPQGTFRLVAGPEPGMLIPEPGVEIGLAL